MKICYRLSCCVLVSLLSLGCYNGGSVESKDSGYDGEWMLFLQDLVLSATSNTITLEQPTFTTTADPVPQVLAYIGDYYTIKESSGYITGALEGNVDVAHSGYVFAGLQKSTRYKVIVKSINSKGYSVKEAGIYTNP